jgi:hypothetical protein
MVLRGGVHHRLHSDSLCGGDDLSAKLVHAKEIMTKKFVWIGMFVGSSIGNMLPTLWGGDAISLSGVMFALAGGFIGIWVGYRIGQSM